MNYQRSTQSPRVQPHLLGFWLLLSALPVSAAIVVQTGQNITGTTFGINSTAVPADANGAVGPNHFVEFVNGRYSVYLKSTGKRVQTMTDLTFWTSAGVAVSSGSDVTDPRIVFDTYSQRWFAAETDYRVRRQSGNHFLLTVSANSDPAGSWQGVAFAADPVKGYFADFPTLGVDPSGVYLSADMFDPYENSVGPMLLAIPKNGLLANPPGIAGLKSFSTLSYGVRGHILQPAVTTGSASTSEFVLAIGSLGDDFRSHTSLVASTIRNASAAGNATLSTASVLTVPSYAIPLSPPQPGVASRNLDNGDTRFSACVRRVGDVLSAVHSVTTNSRSAIRWYKINAASAAVLQTGTIADSSLHLFYPSIAANEAGTVVIACNGCSSSVYVSSYAVAGETVNGTLSFGNLTLLKSGTANYQDPDLTGLSRWGDYSATSVDPTDPNRFWTIQTIPIGKTVWATQITELITIPVRLTITLADKNIVISLPAGVADLQLQYSPTLEPTAQWAPVAQTPVISNNQMTVVLPSATGQGYFRLVKPQITF